MYVSLFDWIWGKSIYVCAVCSLCECFPNNIRMNHSIKLPLSHHLHSCTTNQDAGTIAALDEANPMAHPDTLRRKRTLRDAGLAAKADPAAWASSGEGVGAAEGRGSVRSRQNSAGSAGGGGQTTVSTRLALHSSSNRYKKWFGCGSAVGKAMVGA